MRGKFDVETAALVLAKRFGEDCAAMAYRREQFCRARGEEGRADEWRAVLKRLASLYFAPKPTRLH